MTREVKSYCYTIFLTSTKENLLRDCRNFLKIATYTEVLDCDSTPAAAHASPAPTFEGPRSCTPMYLRNEKKTIPQTRAVAFDPRKNPRELGSP